MRTWFVGIFLFGGLGASHAGTITSAYTDLDADKHCKVVSKAAEGDGDWIDMECAGYKDYKVRLFASDARESATYGYDVSEPAWESFSAFNSVSDKVEWRLDDGVPFAAIHRWNVTANPDGVSSIAVLAVEKVGQSGAPGSCAVALVRASGNPKANEQARQIADAKARSFVCDEQQAERIGDVPDFGREKR